MRKRSVVSLLLVVVMLLGVISVSAQDEVALGPVTQTILNRDDGSGGTGLLICGVNQTLAGFGLVDETGEFSGFDVDFCRAIAAAVLGDANKVLFRPLTANDRQAAIQGGEIDMMARNTTWTLSRDVVWGATFGPVNFYDGQGIMVPTELGISTIEELDGGSICVQQGTTTELNLADAITSRGLDIETPTYPDNPSTTAAYLEGRCDGLTTDKSGLASIRATQEDPGAHTILELTISKEPLAPLSPQSDPQFADIVAWTSYGLIQAEEFGITSQNIDEYLDSDNPEIQRLFGLNDNPSGSYLGIDNQFMITVIRQVGNYGEIYERNLGIETVFGLERGLNALWTDGGLMYAMPFR